MCMHILYALRHIHSYMLNLSRGQCNRKITATIACKIIILIDFDRYKVNNVMDLGIGSGRRKQGIDSGGGRGGGGRHGDC